MFISVIFSYQESVHLQSFVFYLLNLRRIFKGDICSYKKSVEIYHHKKDSFTIICISSFEFEEDI